MKKLLVLPVLLGAILTLTTLETFAAPAAKTVGYANAAATSQVAR